MEHLFNMYSFSAPKWRWNSRWIDHRFTFFTSLPSPHIHTRRNLLLLLFLLHPSLPRLYLSTSTVMCTRRRKKKFFLRIFSANVFSYSRGSYRRLNRFISKHFFFLFPLPPLTAVLFILFDFMCFFLCAYITTRNVM